jgi:hypothetical protein
VLQNGWSVEAARPGHVNRIANRLREIDRMECAAFGHTPKQGVRGAFNASSLSWTAMRHGQPQAMFGLVIVSVLAGVGRPWMLGTDALDEGMRELVTWSPRFVEAMERETPTLENHVAVENRRSIRYLRRLGFAFDPEPVTIGGIPMLRFSKGP